MMFASIAAVHKRVYHPWFGCAFYLRLVGDYQIGNPGDIWDIYIYIYLFILFYFVYLCYFFIYLFIHLFIYLRMYLKIHINIISLYYIFNIQNI